MHRRGHTLAQQSPTHRWRYRGSEMTPEGALDLGWFLLGNEPE
jgi:hypothetical protein